MRQRSPYKQTRKQRKENRIRAGLIGHRLTLEDVVNLNPEALAALAKEIEGARS